MATFNHAAALPWREFFYRDPFAGPGSIAKSSGMGLQISETRCPFPNGNNAGTDRLIPLRIFAAARATAYKPHSGVQASFDRCVGYIGPKMA
jgi:hypothetical protein